MVVGARGLGGVLKIKKQIFGHPGSRWVFNSPLRTAFVEVYFNILLLLFIKKSSQRKLGVKQLGHNSLCQPALSLQKFPHEGNAALSDRFLVSKNKNCGSDSISLSILMARMPGA